MTLHQLHHRPELEDIRSAYDSDRSWHSDYESDLSYPRSHTSSYKSYTTQPTMYSTTSSKRSPQVHNPAYTERSEPPLRYFDDRPPEESPNASVETYASTVDSAEQLAGEEPIPQYNVPQATSRPYQPCAIPATPSDFSELFPSHRKLNIRHDDSTLDGNMNLRIDTAVSLHGGRRCDMTLFHLRMHDLRNREFSLRRYCRDSGREVCHSARKMQKSSGGRPSLQRSLSNALGTIRFKTDQKSPKTSSLTRNDSGYGSTQSSIDFDADDRPVSESGIEKSHQAGDVNSVGLEFSNYAQVEVRRLGVKASKRYEFEYWGTSYAWRRVIRKGSQSKCVSYHLTKAGSETILAYITPSPLSPAEAEDEHNKGGWVPPCSMWIADETIVCGQKDVADVIVSSGLIALVDDSIRARFHGKESQRFMIPKLQKGVEYMDPKRLINEMFKRDGSHNRQSSSSRPSSSHRS